MAKLPEISTIIESQTNYETTSRLANESFGRGTNHFSGHYLKWMYEVAFGGRTSVIAAMHEGQKIGQAVILWHEIKLEDKVQGCAQLIDLFVVPEYRSISVVRQIYGKLKKLLDERPDCIVITTPNPKSAPLNTRFLKLRPGEILDIRLGMTIPSPYKHTTCSLWVNSDNRNEMINFMQGFVGAGNTVEVSWTPESMVDRLSNKKHQYVIHKNGPLLAITSSRTFKGIALFLICALFTKHSNAYQKSHLRKILSAAAFQHRRPLYLYVGINHTLPVLPGASLPTRLRPSQMLLQIREGESAKEKISFDRFEAIDFDFA